MFSFSGTGSPASSLDKGPVNSLLCLQLGYISKQVIIYKSE